MHALRVVVSHGLQGVDKVHEFETSIHILIVPLNVIDDVGMLQLLSAFVLGQEDAQVVRVHDAVRILVDDPEDRQDRVVKAADKLLLQELDTF